MKNFFNIETCRKIAETVATASLATVSPVAAVGYQAMIICMDRAKEFKSEKIEKRVTDFHERFVYETDDPIFFTEEVVDDYTRLIESMIRDDEDEKVDYYSRMFVSFARGDVAKKEKLYLLKMVRELTSYEIEFLRKMNICNNFDVKGGRSTSNTSSSYCLARLKEIHIVEDVESKHVLTPMGEMFLRLIYSADELTPEAIGKKVWRNIIYYPISFSDLNTTDSVLHGRVMDALSNVLNAYDFKTEGHGLFNSQIDDYKLLFPGRLLVVHDGQICEKLAEKLSRRLLGGCGIVVCVTDDPESDSLAHLKEGGKLIYLNMPKSPEHIPKIKSQFREIMESIVNYEKTHPKD